MMNIERYAEDQLKRTDLSDNERQAVQGVYLVVKSWVEVAGNRVTRDFSKGARKDLERNHAVVFDPLETSLAKLKSARKPFWYITCQDNEGFMNLLSRPSQVAIFPEPEKFYIPESNNLSLKEQEDLVKVDQAEVLKAKMGIDGVEEVIDNVATNAGLVFAHFDKTGGKVRLHGKDYGYRYTRTNTLTVGSGVAAVGSFRGGSGLFVSGWDADDGHSYVWVSRLVVPAQE
jgi:hypothetical protein